jgi:hypothetical protein
VFDLSNRFARTIRMNCFCCCSKNLVSIKLTNYGVIRWHCIVAVGIMYYSVVGGILHDEIEFPIRLRKFTDRFADQRYRVRPNYEKTALWKIIGYCAHAAIIIVIDHIIIRLVWWTKSGLYIVLTMATSGWPWCWVMNTTTKWNDTIVAKVSFHIEL